MFPNSGSEGNELYSVVDQFLKSRSSSSSGNVAHTGLPHEHAGEHGAAQLPQAPNAVSGHPLANPDDSWMDYFNDVFTEDNSKLYQRLGHEGQSLPVASWGEYMQHPQDINRGVAGWSEPLPAHAYPGALHAHPQPHMLQGIEPSSYEPWTLNKPSPNAPGTLHAHPQPHMLQGIEPSSYVPGEISRPSPSAPDTYQAHPQPHMLQGIEPSSYEPWTLNKPSPNAPGTLHARPQPYMLQGTEPSSYPYMRKNVDPSSYVPWTLNKPSPYAPGTLQARFHPYMRKNVDLSSYVPREISKPSQFAPGSSTLPIHAPGTSSKQRVTAATANVVDSRVATDPDPRAALSMEDDPKRLYVGPYPRPSLEQEQEFLTTKGHQLFSDENIRKLEVKGRKYFIQDSDKDLDRAV
ncbi:hypothetical protein ACQY0O_003702 [Thecaphora frezii]